MKVVPMIFNTDMVKALMAGDKVVTRRPAKNLSFSERVGFIVGEWAYGIGWNLRETMNNCIRSKSAKCPSKIGDLIYVRETFGCCGVRSVYKADDDGASCMVKKWTPSIHMPRTESRLTLKVTDVRIERVQDITEEQCWKEGVEHIDGQFDIHQLSEMAKTFDGTFEDAKALFACLWDSIYQDWNQNPYVWVIEFEVIHQNVDKYLESVKEAA
ncbi:hypothetical protein [Vibrio cholerae]|uniref:hypothetical protein n=1 Tax=Vibrio cholerae TaxID=666 RepID=UPI0030810853